MPYATYWIMRLTLQNELQIIRTANDPMLVNRADHHERIIVRQLRRPLSGLRMRRRFAIFRIEISHHA